MLKSVLRVGNAAVRTRCLGEAPQTPAVLAQCSPVRLGSPSCHGRPSRKEHWAQRGEEAIALSTGVWDSQSLPWPEPAPLVGSLPAPRLVHQRDLALAAPLDGPRLGAGGDPPPWLFPWPTPTLSTPLATTPCSGGSEMVPFPPCQQEAPRLRQR